MVSAIHRLEFKCMLSETRNNSKRLHTIFSSFDFPNLVRPNAVCIEHRARKSYCKNIFKKEQIVTAETVKKSHLCCTLAYNIERDCVCVCVRVNERTIDMRYIP